MRSLHGILAFFRDTISVSRDCVDRVRLQPFVCGVRLFDCLIV
jgi:hypothetical protein